MVETFGLTHIALAVRDVERASRFYQDVLGAVEVYRQTAFAQLQTPGTRDVIVLEEAPERAGTSGGVVHFGFRLRAAAAIGAAVAAVEAAGGRVRETGEFVPGEPYLFALDPDGYEFEIWYELPTPVDPPDDPALAAPPFGGSA
jgi:catechol 2,3-dioxygenase-like lactoylglutathione lyase family enzyme